MKHVSGFGLRRAHLGLIPMLIALVLVPLHAAAQDSADKLVKSEAGNEAKSEAKSTALPEIKITTGRVRPGTLEDIARTGSKTDTPLRDIPASIAVVPAALLQEQGAIDMNDAMRNVSSVQPLMGGGYGFGNSFTSRGLALSYLRDDLPDGGAQNSYFRTMYDVDRIEVLKGPGSALFGVAGPGGSINMITKKPQYNFDMSVGTMLGSFGTRNGFLDLTGAIPYMPNMAGRVIANMEHTDGFRGLERNIVEASPSFIWRLAPDKTLLIDFDHREMKIKPDNYGILFDGNSHIASVSRETRYYTPFNKTDHTINRLGLIHNWAISDVLSMRTAFTYDARTLDLIRNGGGNQGNAAGIVTGRDVRSQFDNAGYTQLQNEFIWKTNTGPVKHTFLGGFEYKNTDIQTTRADFTLLNINLLNPVIPETSLNGLTRRPIFDRRISSDQTSFYAQDQIDLTDKFKLRLGIRNDLVKYSDKGFQSVSGNYGYREIVETKSLTTYSTGGVYQPTKNLAFYTGYSTGAFINLATEAQNVSRAPETSDQIEVGAKTALLDGKVDFNVALFQTSRNNYFITLPGSGGQATQDGNDRSRGVEISFGVRPMPGLNIIGNGVWMDPETLSRNVATNAVLGITRSVFGTRPAGVATHMGSLWGTYTLQSGLARGLMLGFGVTYKGDSYADTLNLLKIPSYVVLDAAVSYSIKRMHLAVNIKNLTDATYYTNPTFAGALPGNPLSAFGSIRFNFN
ncbi:iron complex outermembrane receptor protein [Nitrosospira sp. Nsp5]|uniref:Iron complex outermembrane recepter protein n=1 Tax=Nitrosospira multiformis TaxID=1231 RepID=A0ABY0T5I0_9PROT|nr:MULTISPECIES: TonB-dependent receptor [Nitrosospira]PTR09629.1 iron complex outermembrane receptor protein [Nitrosospira sp. Nsp5]SDQ25837.1 iron complex outermembrane recepter protein [Nitrosospira multiformis]